MRVKVCQHWYSVSNERLSSGHQMSHPSPRVAPRGASFFPFSSLPLSTPRHELKRNWDKDCPTHRSARYLVLLVRRRLMLAGSVAMEANATAPSPFLPKHTLSLDPSPHDWHIVTAPIAGTEVVATSAEENRKGKKGCWVFVKGGIGTRI